MINLDYSDWERVHAIIDQYFDDRYVQTDRLARYAIVEFVRAINDDIPIDSIRLAEQLYNMVIPLPSGVGIGSLVPENEIDYLNRGLIRAFRSDLGTMDDTASQISDTSEVSMEE